MKGKTVEEQIQEAGLTAARVTPADIEAEIHAEYFYTADAGVPEGIPIMPSLRLMTICVLVLKNGFTVMGKSACASPENFNPDIGRRIARDNAIEEIWPLLGFRLRDKISAQAAETYAAIVRD